MDTSVQIVLGLFMSIFSSVISEQPNGGNITCEVGTFLEPSLPTDTPIQVDGGPIPGTEFFTKCEKEDKDYCQQMATEEIKMALYETKGGNLTVIVNSEEGYTLGDYFCDKADQVVQDDVRNREIRFYWRFCGQPWSRTEYKMKLTLCCEDALYVACKPPNNRDEL